MENIVCYRTIFDDDTIGGLRPQAMVEAGNGIEPVCWRWISDDVNGGLKPQGLVPYWE